MACPDQEPEGARGAGRPVRSADRPARFDPACRARTCPARLRPQIGAASPHDVLEACPGGLDSRLQLGVSLNPQIAEPAGCLLSPGAAAAASKRAACRPCTTAVATMMGRPISRRSSANGNTQSDRSQRSPFASSLRTCSTSTATVHMSKLPERVLTKAILVPSGDQAGPSS